MTSIIYVGMDVHTQSHSVCAYRIGEEEVFAETSFAASADNIEKYLEILKQNFPATGFICGYEAGCLGYSLYRDLTKRGIECRILAPSTMATSPLDNIKKNDRLDARKIARCLAYGSYRKVYVLDEEDDAVKEYIRMRDDANAELKRVKQQITAMCVRHGKQYSGTKNKWTVTYRAWLKKLEMESPLLRETLDEYLLRLQQLEEKLTLYDKRIAEFAESERYADTVKKLTCFKGIATHTAVSLAAEIGDFRRFPTAGAFSAYLGLTPGEHSSSTSHHTLGITKAGNSHIRRLLVESAQSFNRGRIGQKSAALRKRQEGNSHAVIQYADKANERLRRKYMRLTTRTSVNVAKTAIARELACFIWGMMTDHIS